MKNFKKGYNTNEIIEYAKTLERDNGDDIYIWFVGACYPIVFGRSAACLVSYFPEIKVEDASSSDKGDTIFGYVTFPFHRVLDLFFRYSQQLDDHCLHIIGVKNYSMY